jgi:hypothetical protein
VEGGILAILSSIKRSLNPMNHFDNLKGYFSNSGESVFRSRQNELSSYDNRFYPYTPLDPCKPWYDRLRISIF